MFSIWDGILTHELLKTGRPFSAALIDGSEDMLAKAGERFRGFEGIKFIKASFQEIIRGAAEIGGSYDLVVSSMAIHHLSLREKKSLFEKTHALLNGGGYFVNIDVVLAPTGLLDFWYMNLWREWMEEKKASLGVREEEPVDIIERYRDNADNKPDTLDDQLNALRGAGFRDVDCFYKYGIFSVYGGRK
ncbi:MAG TPA: class I SAM-dependent methyltransferase [Dissulfurispiraceae bacterium]